MCPVFFEARLDPLRGKVNRMMISFSMDMLESSNKMRLKMLGSRTLEQSWV